MRGFKDSLEAYDLMESICCKCHILFCPDGIIPLHWEGTMTFLLLQHPSACSTWHIKMAIILTSCPLAMLVSSFYSLTHTRVKGGLCAQLRVTLSMFWLSSVIQGSARRHLPEPSVSDVNQLFSALWGFGCGEFYNSSGRVSFPDCNMVPLQAQ